MKIVYLAILLFLLAGIAGAGSPAPEPPETDGPPAILTAPIGFFQKYVSAADGQRCPMTPSCSSYAKEAVERHGALMGWIMACDRLMRCGRDELRRAPLRMTRDGIRCHDPVDDNDFWWP